MNHRLAATLEAFIAYQADHRGISPTIRELMPLIGLRSFRQVKGRIDKLIALGFLERIDGLARTTHLVKGWRGTRVNGQLAVWRPVEPTP